MIQGLINLFIIVFIVGFIIVGLCAAPAIPQLIVDFFGFMFGRRKEEPIEPRSRLRVKRVVTESEPIGDIVVCTYCGSMIPEGSRFCTSCGAPR